jgi:PAS domain S-box-containing protein
MGINGRKRADETLRESREFLNKIINSIPDPIHVKDRQHRVILINDAACRLFNLSREEIIGKTAYELFPGKEMAEISWQKDEEVFTTGEECVNEETNTYAPGTTLTVLVKKTLYTDAAGNQFLVGITTDITERKRAEEALSASEELFREVFNNANDAIFLHEMTPEGPGKYILVNDLAIKSLGYTREEFLRMSPGDIVPKTVSEWVLPYTLPKLRKDGHATFESIHIRKDGSEYPVEVSTHTFPFKGRNVALSIVRDITERKRTEETQSQLTEFRESVITNARVWLSVLDQRGKILLWNTAAEEISGYRAEEVIGKNEIWKLLYPQKEYRKHITDTITRIIRDRKYLENFETSIRSKQGKEKVISWNTKGIPDAAGRISDYIAIGVDITDRQQAEQMLRESEERYRTVIENASEAIIVAQDGLLKYANPRAMELLQSTAEKTIGRPFTDFIHPDDRALVFERYQRRIRGENVPVNYDFRLIGATGRLVWIILSAVRITWNGSPATLNFLTDITERKQVETALRESEEKFRTVLEHIPDLVLVHRNGMVLYVNPAMVQTMGYTPDEVLNKPILDYIVPEHHQRVVDAIRTRMSTGSIESYEIELVTKTGGHRIVIVRGTVIEFGGSPAILNVLADITDRKHAEEALQETDERYRSLFDRSLDCVYVHDFAGNFIDANPSALKLLGYTRDEIPAMNFVSLLTPDQISADQKVIQEVIATGTQKESSEFRVRQKDGGYVDIETTATLLYHHGKPYAILGIAHDITERKRIEETLKRFNEELEQGIKERTAQINASLEEKVLLLREIHHRVKNNLQIIISLLKLQSRYITDENTIAAFRECQSRVMAMSLVHEKLYQSADISKINLGNYVRFLGNSLFQFYGMKGKGILLNTDIQDILIGLNTAIPVGLIINELVSNSLKHAFPDGRKGEISVAIQREEHTLTILFKDNGVGIPEDLDWRNAKSLGLRLVITLVEQLQGTIELDRSEGTAFSIVVKEKE